MINFSLKVEKLFSYSFIFILLDTLIRLILLDTVIYDLKITHNLGAEGGELSESIIRVDFRHD